MTENLFRVRTRLVKGTKTRAARIRVETVHSDGNRSHARTLGIDYAADNPHTGAVTEYLHSLGYEHFTIYFSGKTNSGRGTCYAVSLV
jgi:hypothetical protein